MQFCALPVNFQDKFKQFLQNWHCKTAAEKPKACYNHNQMSITELFTLNVRFKKSTLTVRGMAQLTSCYQTKTTILVDTQATGKKIYLSAQSHIWSYCFFSPRRSVQTSLGSTEGFSGSPGQLSSKTIEEVALLQLVVPPASQKAEHCSFACLLAGLRHVSLMS